MKEILVISKEFYPNETANTNCLYKVIDALQKRNYKITVVSGYRTSETDKEYENIFDCDLYRTVNKEQPIMDKLSNDLGNSFLKYLFLPILKLLYIISAYSENPRMMKRGRKLKKEKHFAYIISVLQPHNNHRVAYRIVSKKDKWVMFNLDPYAFNFDPEPFSKIRLKKWLKKVTGVINTDGIDAENKRHNFYPYKNILHIDSPLPNLEIPLSTTHINIGYPRKLVYTGRFYDKIRKPEPLLNILKNLDPEKYRVEFYGSSCSYLLEKFEHLPQCVNLMGEVDVETCKKITENADILLNVSNTITNQIPSKVFEYIGSGRPIVNIYFSDNDPSLPYLEKYPQILNIKANDNIDIEKVNLFLENTEFVPSEQLKIIYKDVLAESVLNRIADFIETC